MIRNKQAARFTWRASGETKTCRNMSFYLDSALIRNYPKLSETFETDTVTVTNLIIRSLLNITKVGTETNFQETPDQLGIEHNVLKLVAYYGPDKKAQDHLAGNLEP